MWKEFKEFAFKGNVVDLAIGVVIGLAFGAVINSFVKDILMPPIGLLLGRVDFSNLFISLSGKHYSSLAAAQSAGAPTINYGTFINTLLNFIIIAFAVFLVVRMVNRNRPATIKDCPYCKSKIPTAATRCPQCTSEVGSAPGSPPLA